MAVSLLRGWQQLAQGERVLLVKLMLLLPLVALALRLRGYAWTRAQVERLSARQPRHDATHQELAQAERLAQLAGIAGRRGAITATCLRQALVVFGLLRRRSLRPELKIGVRRGDAGVEAHAWVELEGQPLAQANIPVHQSFADPGARA